MKLTLISKMIRQENGNMLWSSKETKRKEIKMMKEMKMGMTMRRKKRMLLEKMKIS